MIPVRDIKKMQGFLKGIDTTIKEEEQGQGVNLVDSAVGLVSCRQPQCRLFCRSLSKIRPNFSCRPSASPRCRASAQQRGEDAALTYGGPHATGAGCGARQRDGSEAAKQDASI
ncbi:MAG: hypothetical protein MZV70_58900 [Desulfobacterales bacterium]|nr:hypothetical protein [Desulfobacterales bacterium]